MRQICELHVQSPAHKRLCYPAGDHKHDRGEHAVRSGIHRERNVCRQAGSRFNEVVVSGDRIRAFNGVDTERFRPGNDVRAEARKTLGIPEEALVFGTVGRLDIQKRPKALLSLFVELKRSFPDLYLVLVGSGLLEDEIRRQVKSLGLIDSVVFVGFSKRVEKVLPALDLFVILSSVEGFGTATVEAMACGLPVVGTDVPGTRDILMDSKSGTLVPLDDQEATVKACAQYLGNHQLRKTVGREARQEAVKKYDIREWEKRILEFYAKVLSRPNGSLN